METLDPLKPLETPAQAGGRALSPIEARRAAAGERPALATTLTEELEQGRSRLRLLLGCKYLRPLEKLIGDLRRLYPHGNRDLHFDDVMIILLLGFFNIDIRSLRKLEMLSEVAGVRQKLSVGRICRSTLSDALKLFDPAGLRGLVDELRKALPSGKRSDPALQELFEKIVLYDGSYFRVPARVHWAIHEKSRANKSGRQVRLNLHLCLATGSPECLSIGGEGDSEAKGIINSIEPDMIYVADRGIFSFDGVKAIVEGNAHFVLRLKKAVGFTFAAQRIVTPEDARHGISSDRVGHLTGSYRWSAPATNVREIVIENPEDPDQPIRLLTDLVDLPAHIIGHIYRQRWSIELFFRWLKVYANFEHMISHSEKGAETWFYVAVIGTLLICLYTETEPNTYVFTAMGLILSGQTTYEEMAPALARRARESRLNRERLARKRAAKNSA